MAIHVECSCGKPFDVPESLAGKTGRCKGCGAKFLIPMLSSVRPSIEPVAEIEPVYATTVFVPKASRLSWSGRKIFSWVRLIGSGFILGIVSTLIHQNMTRPPETNFERCQSVLDPYRQAAFETRRSLDSVAAECFTVSRNLHDRGIVCHPATIAILMTSVVRGERVRTHDATKAGDRLERSAAWIESRVAAGIDPCSMARSVDDPAAYAR